MLFSLKDLLRDGQKPVSVQLSDTIAHALELMAEHDFSQLPVADLQGKTTGKAVTEGSILDAIRFFNTSPDKLRVKDATVSVQKFRADDDLLEALDDIQNETFVIIVDAEDRLTGIVTTADTTAHLRRYAEDLMIVQFIEETLKQAVESVYHAEQPRLEEAIQRVTDRSSEIRKRFPNAISCYLEKTGHSDGKPDTCATEAALSKLNLPTAGKSFDLLTFDEITKVLLLHEKSPRLEQSDGDTELRTLLESVRDVRNKLAHFRGDLTPVERKQLRFAATWLERNLPSAPPEPKEKASPKEKEPLQGIEVAPLEEASIGDDSVYAPLAAYLESQPGDVDEVKMKFEELEVITGKKLPKSAYEYRAWWANDPGKPHAALWLNAGWRAQYINMTERRLTFIRIAEREDAYIRFYSEVRNRLSKSVGFPLSPLGPQGQSWQILAELRWLKPSAANINASFTRTKRLRVELYLDCGNASTNKEKFDQLYGRKDIVESAIGEPLEWERMENRRASRIHGLQNSNVRQDKVGEEQCRKIDCRKSH
jgi:CBS domain-containing protein